ncbi:simple sugar transport system permease protein/D-xylose transport system permease protein [Promicromonospora sp. AC04]|uniref:sugar ABC transporter permease n=1 Tax=Promicromonospora sp. AC04 TaxID=2135723 RepID=UPI000D407FA5|nr:sugar ABC transporter permease [Promicromonospora sp. AC04]PUB26306.1 simple sugar transport system permease protein/D-xylose transport system permease protein [Promicromonospora sp. AC04]
MTAPANAQAGAPGAGLSGAGLPGAVWQRVRGGNSLLPIVVALVGIWIVLGAVNPAFLAPENLVNLTLQSAPVGVIALGVVLVLLVGQIDLSVGSVSGLAAAVVAVGSVTLGWPVALAILAALACGVVVGLGYGALSTRLGLPSFVFTLAGLLFLAGVQLRVLGPLGSINLPFESWFVLSVQQGFLPTGVAWALVAVVVVATAAVRVAARARRRRADLASASVPQIVVRTLVLAAVLSAIVAYLGTARGIGYSVVLFALLVVVTDVLLRRTRWGRSVRAVGGDRRAAMLAGVPVQRTVVLCFVACSTLAALGGVLAAGRLGAANQGTGGADTYLVAIAAAVIGGTSLFGGRGSAWSAVLGVLVIQSIANGLTLMNVDQAARYMVTGAVLLLAIIIDMLVRKRREA